MALSSRLRRSERRLQNKRPKKRKAAAAGKRRKAVRKVGRTADPGIVETVLATFAHEVRTPLTGILAISDLLATSELGERERRWVDTIKAGAEHLASLATLFVDAARSRHAEFGIRKDFFDLRTL
ncbi:histidine kinase dimerization/phospho-acceptor domain-containing protein, partial [Bradyrhizobium sp.]